MTLITHAHLKEAPLLTKNQLATHGLQTSSEMLTGQVAEADEGQIASHTQSTNFPVLMASAFLCDMHTSAEKQNWLRSKRKNKTKR